MGGEHAAEMMSPAAGLHPDNARRKLLRQSNQRLPPHLATHHNRAGRIQPNHAAHVLAEVDAKHRDIHTFLLLIRRRAYDAGRRGGPFHKTLRASEHDRPDIKQAREEWTLTRQPIMRLEPHRLVFLDETGTTTKMARLRGRSPKGQRLLSKVPFGHWKTQTFIAGLRCDALTAPFVIDAPMDRRIFETYVETQLAPTLRPGDVVVLDNLPAHKSAAAEQAVRAMGAWFLFLPPYSPDLNPIEMAFAKLKALLRARAVRTIDALWRAIGEICDLFSPQECQNYFHAAGYRLT